MATKDGKPTTPDEIKDKIMADFENGGGQNVDAAFKAQGQKAPAVAPFPDDFNVAPAPDGGFGAAVKDFFKPVRGMFADQRQTLPTSNPFLTLERDKKYLVLANLLEREEENNLQPHETLYGRLELLSRCRNVCMISMIQQSVRHTFGTGAFDAAGTTADTPEARQALKRTGNDDNHSHQANMALQMVLGDQYLRMVDHARGYQMSNLSAFINGVEHALAAGDF